MTLAELLMSNGRSREFPIPNRFASHLIERSVSAESPNRSILQKEVLYLGVPTLDLIQSLKM